MDPDLEKLIRLQRAESELRRVEVELAEIPKVRSALEGRLAGEKARLEAARAALEACQKSRRQHEAGLQDVEVKRSKYKGQLMEVKTNKEYTAVLHEIENVEREIRALEDKILLEMERAESLASELKREEGLFKAAEEGGRVEVRSLEARAAGLEGEAGKLGGERDAIAATIPADALDLFQRLARRRGAAVAEARDGMCQLCHVKLRPQMYVDVKKNEGIVQCPACSRILYYSPPVAAVSPEL
jgi:predicted  nucleic acid-binding Zn-ribbon protein